MARRVNIRIIDTIVAELGLGLLVLSLDHGQNASKGIPLY